MLNYSVAELRKTSLTRMKSLSLLPNLTEKLHPMATVEYRILNLLTKLMACQETLL